MRHDADRAAVDSLEKAAASARMLWIGPDFIKAHAVEDAGAVLAADAGKPMLSRTYRAPACGKAPEPEETANFPTRIRQITIQERASGESA